MDATFKSASLDGPPAWCSAGMPAHSRGAAVRPAAAAEENWPHQEDAGQFIMNTREHMLYEQALSALVLEFADRQCSLAGMVSAMLC